MKVGDLVIDEYDESIGLVVSTPRLSNDCDQSILGVMKGDIYYVVDVLWANNGEVMLFTTDEVRVISEGR